MKYQRQVDVFDPPMPCESEFAGATQAKHIPADVVLVLVAYLAERDRINRELDFTPWVLRWELNVVLDAPPKVIRAKLARLMDKGLMTGCLCGCRGDLELTPEGRRLALDALIADA
jgi:hypothetical protein